MQGCQSLQDPWHLVSVPGEVLAPGDGELLAPGEGEPLDPGDGELLNPGEGLPARMPMLISKPR